MSRIPTPDLKSATGATAEIYAQIKKAAGKVPNTYAVIGAHGSAALKAILEADRVLADGTLNKQDQEVIKLLVSEIVGCEYCLAAHSLLANQAGLDAKVVRRIRSGLPTGDEKRDALANFVRILLQTRGTVNDREFLTIKSAGYTPQQLVDISLAIAVITFTNVFNRINDTDLDFPAAA